MKLKYKKLIVLVALGTMFLSFIILSMVPTGGDSTVDPEEAKLEEVKNEEIQKLMEQYFTAKAKVDMETLATLVSDIAQLSQEKLAAKAAYVEGYQNLKCHIIENEGQNSYRVYVQYDMKIIGINTLAPSLSAFYVKLASDEKYLVYLSALDVDEEDFIQAADKNMEVIKLKEDTAKKFEQAIAADAALKQFYDTLNQQNAETDTVEQSPAPTTPAPASQPPASQAPASQPPAS